MSKVLNPQIAKFADFNPFADTAPPEVDFPVDSFPEPLRAYIKAAARSFQVDPAMVAVSVLGVLSAIFQRQGYEVEVNSDWLEPTNLYLMISANPSERKSPVMKAVTSALTKAICKWNDDHMSEIDYQRNLIETAEIKIKVLQSKLAKNTKGASQEDLQEAVTNLQDLKDN